MPVILISAGTTSASPLRTLSLRVIALGAGVTMAALFAGGVGLGHWLSSAPAAAAPPAVSAAQAPGAVLPFALEQLGALSGRLFRLESQAGQLSARIGVAIKAQAAPTPAPADKPAPTAVPGRGGPLLPARSALETSPDALGSLAALEARLGQVEQQIGLVADAASMQNLARLRMPSRLPVSGAELTSTFGNREDPFTGHSAFHSGLDFAVAYGTTIRAAAGGKIGHAGFTPDFGWSVDIEHGNGLVTRYAHASRLFVKSGDLVLPGDAIAAVGSTGRSTGAHLHFEVLRDGTAVDPKRYLVGL